jgi:predicted acetyltransferase
MHRSVEMMHDQGYLVSALYPFSFRYYRKFGWESVGDRITYEDFRQSDLRRCDEAALVRAARGPEDAARCAGAYAAYASNLNAMIVRDADGWTKRLETLVESGGHPFLIEKDGETLGYFFCEHPRDAEGRIKLLVRDFAITHPTGWRALFGFLATIPNNVVSMSLIAPAYPTLMHHFSEPTVRKVFWPGFMFRVLDVGKAVAVRGFGPLAGGTFTARITDEHAPWNTGTWRFTFDDGNGSATRDDAATADFVWTIQVFSQIYAGQLDSVALAERGLFAAPSLRAAAVVRDAFFDAPPHLMDFF